MDLGFVLQSAEDLKVLREIVRTLRATVGRPLTGIEIGSWLGRGTLTMLAPDLPLGQPLPGDNLLWALFQSEYSDFDEVVTTVETLFKDVGGDPLKELKQQLIRHACLRVRRNTQYFSRLYVIDTWKGIESERSTLFIEQHPKGQFWSNMRLARFDDVVTMMEGDSSVLLSCPVGPVDFVCIDGDHEYEAVVRDLFAIRTSIHPKTVVCGHDITNRKRWPGVYSAVERFVKHFQIAEGYWIANPEGVAHLLSLPDFEHFAAEVRALDAQQRSRYTAAATSAPTVENADEEITSGEEPPPASPTK